VLAAPNAFDPAEVPGNRLLRRPVNSGNLTFNSTFWRMNWNFSSFFVGQRTDSDFLGLGFTRNPGYARFDLAGSYNLVHGISFYGRITNLANKQYQDVLGYPALGREFRIGLKYTTRHE
jgi:outer membrane cobalamin receptor